MFHEIRNCKLALNYGLKICKLVIKFLTNFLVDEPLPNGNQRQSKAKQNQQQQKPTAFLLKVFGNLSISVQFEVNGIPAPSKLLPLHIFSKETK